MKSTTQHNDPNPPRIQMARSAHRPHPSFTEQVSRQCPTDHANTLDNFNIQRAPTFPAVRVHQTAMVHLGIDRATAKKHPCFSTIIYLHTLEPNLQIILPVPIPCRKSRNYTAHMMIETQTSGDINRHRAVLPV